jgi:hypothetical protein
MPIEINASNDLNEVLINSINRIMNNIENNLLDELSIVITDLQNIPILFPSTAVPNEHDLFSRILRTSFAITQPKWFAGIERKHVIILILKLLERLN